MLIEIVVDQIYEDFHADSGKRIVRHFCGDCGSALYSYPDSMPDKVFVKAGSLDQLDRVVPKVEIVRQMEPVVARRKLISLLLSNCDSLSSASSTAPLGESKRQTSRDHIEPIVDNPCSTLVKPRIARPPCSRG